MGKPNSTKFGEFNTFPESGWHKFISENITIFFHTDTISLEDYPSHRHSDLTSFVLYFKNFPVLVDTGRFNYISNDPLGSHGFTAKAHNSILIDDLDPQAGINNRKFPDFYRSSTVKTKFVLSDDYFQFSVEHSGFLRLFKEKVSHIRTFQLFEKKIIIEDEIEGKKNHKIDTYFHWYPGIEIERGINKVSFKSKKMKNFNGSFYLNESIKDGKKIKFKRFNNEASGLGYYFPNYGIKEGTTSILYTQNSKLPLKNQFIMNWGG